MRSAKSLVFDRCRKPNSNRGFCVRLSMPEDCFSPTGSSEAAMSVYRRQELVVLVHGLGCNSLVMRVLERHLRADGYQTHCWGYRSLRGSVDEHACRLRCYVDSLAEQNDVIHFVAHSMGSIVTRRALYHRPLPQVGRIVLIAPPNRGSPLAGVAAPLLRRLCPPIGQLSNRADSFVNCIPATESLDVGVIAAHFDVFVPGASTVIPGQADHISLPATHTSLLFQPSAARQVRAFLASGAFEHPVRGRFG